MKLDKVQIKFLFFLLYNTHGETASSSHSVVMYRHGKTLDVESEIQKLPKIRFTQKT